MDLTHAELVARGAKWLKGQTNHRYRSPVVLTEFRSYAREVPDVIGMNLLPHYGNRVQGIP